MLTRTTIALCLLFLPRLALADDFDIGVRDLAPKLTESFKHLKDRTKITLESCLDGQGQKRTVCSYKFDDYMVATAAAEPGETQISELTLIATGHDARDAARSIIAYAVAMEALVPSLSRENRGAIVSVLFDGIKIGDDARLTVDGHRYILQKVNGGLWFHLEASESD